MLRVHSALELSNQLDFMFKNTKLWHRQHGIYRFWKVNTVQNDNGYELVFLSDDDKLHFSLILRHHLTFHMEEMIDAMRSIFREQGFIPFEKLDDLPEMDRLLYL